jgi:hypothetical protein
MNRVHHRVTVMAGHLTVLCIGLRNTTVSEDASADEFIGHLNKHVPGFMSTNNILVVKLTRMKVLEL